MARIRSLIVFTGEFIGLNFIDKLGVLKDPCEGASASMNVIKFPSPALTDEDEAAIASKVLSGDAYFSIRRGTDHQGRPCIVLLNRDRAVRGYVVKSRGRYGILDPRGVAVVESWNRDQALAVLSK